MLKSFIQFAASKFKPVEKKWVNATNPITGSRQKGVYFVDTGMVKFSEKHIFHISELKNVIYL